MTTIEQIKEIWEKVISAGMNIELYLGFGNSESENTSVRISLTALPN